jgi:WD40 repeat protein
MLAAGVRLGPYEILAPLGAGGMGEVYRARDTRLGREVALKVLPAEVSWSEEWRKRFEREAQALSRLVHPHVCALFDVGRHADVDYLVMELLSGESLAARLLGGPLPFAEVLRFGAQIASALAAVHSLGITHRDLKPGNVMITPAGAKLLDFGVARMLPQEAAARDLSLASTASLSLTQAGQLLGTVSYMSPEQLEGKRADARSDIFALGAVLFEMATGKRAFPGESSAAIVSAILGSQPPVVSSSQPASPSEFDSLVRTCLRKEPETRWSSVHDVALLLQQIEQGIDAEPRQPGPASSRRVATWLPWAVALLAVALGAAAFLLQVPDPTGLVRAVRFDLPAPGSGAYFHTRDVTALAVSPDGSTLAYVATEPSSGAAPQDPTHGLISGRISRRLWIRRLADLEARPLPGTEGATSVFWSPDGRTVAFFAQGALKRVDLPNVGPVTICPVEARGGLSGTWGKTGEILFAPVQGGGILRVSAAGGSPSVALRPDAVRGEVGVAWPWFLPDGERFLYVARYPGARRVLMMAGAGHAPREVIPVGSKVQFAEPFIVFARDGSLLGQRFDWRSGRVAGAPFALAPQVRSFQTTGSAEFATSSGGTLVWQSVDDSQRLVWFDRSGRELGTMAGPDNYLGIAISPSAGQVVFSRAAPRAGGFSVWFTDLERNVENRITSGLDSACCAVWIPGEKGIVYSGVQGGPPHLFRRDLETGADVELLPPGSFQLAQEVSPDGKSVLYLDRERGGWDLWSVALSGGTKPSPVLESAFNKSDVRFSPDGRHLAFISDESGAPEAYVAPYSGSGQRTRVSTHGAVALRWARAADELLYLSPDRRLWSVQVRSTPTLRLGTPTVRFTAQGHAGWVDFDVTPDGSRILAVVPAVVADELPLHVAVNWPAEAPH